MYERVETALTRAFGTGPHDFVSITGGGGKTALLFYCARGFKSPCALTTTTKMFYPENFRPVCLSQDLRRVQQFLNSAARRVFAARERLPGDKIKGFSAAEAAALYRDTPGRAFFCEADGAARKPYKFYHSHEPVIPDVTTCLVHVIGAETLGVPMRPGYFHRLPEAEDGKIFDTAYFLERMRWFVTEHVKKTMTSILFINKAEGARLEPALRCAAAAAPLFDQAYAGSLRLGVFYRCSSR